MHVLQISILRVWYSFRSAYGARNGKKPVKKGGMRSEKDRKKETTKTCYGHLKNWRYEETNHWMLNIMCKINWSFVVGLLLCFWSYVLILLYCFVHCLVIHVYDHQSTPKYNIECQEKKHWDTIKWKVAKCRTDCVADIRKLIIYLTYGDYNEVLHFSFPFSSIRFAQIITIWRINIMIFLFWIIHWPCHMCIEHR